MKSRILFLGIIMSTTLYAQWMPFGTGVTNGTVIQFEQHNGQMYACGLFSQIDGVTANGLAVYDGSAWADEGLLANAGIHAVKSLNGEVYIALYSNAIDSNYVHVKNGGNWVTVGKGFYLTNASPQNFRFCSLYDLVQHNSSIYVCGEFDRIGNDTIRGIAQWDGSSWQPLGSGLSSNISNTAPQIYPHKMLSTPLGLVVAGNFKFAGDSLVNGVALWDGNNWHPLGEGFNSTAYVLAWFQGQLIAGGDFTASGTTSLKRIAKWDGSSWVDFGMELENTLPNSYCFVHTLSTFSDTLFIAGDFNAVTQNSVTQPANNVVAITPSGYSTPLMAQTALLKPSLFNIMNFLLGDFSANWVQMLRHRAWPATFCCLIYLRMNGRKTHLSYIPIR